MRSGAIGQEAAGLAEEALEGFALDDGERENAGVWAVEAAEYVASRSGEVRWVEELLSADFVGMTLWGKFDAVIANPGQGLEVVDFTFGRPRVTTGDELLNSVGTKIYRMIAGAQEPDRENFRPISITEYHVPTGTSLGDPF